MERPLVSVVIPMLDERDAIVACLDAFEQQSYPTDRLEVLIVDGGSTDGSRQQVEELAADRPWIRLVENPDRRAASGFNRGIEAATGEVVCIFSSHGVPDEHYVSASVTALDETGADGVGGRYHHVGTDPTSSAIGLAMVSPFGMASSHRFVTDRREVDTISHPAYRASVLEGTGGFDETLERNSDYELNYRLREAGARLVVDPDVSSIYRPRPSLGALARQFWWYGRWKERVARRHPGSVRPRHLVAPAAVAGLVVAPVLSRWRWGRRLVGTAALAYAVGDLLAVAQQRPADHDADPVVLALAFPTMHLAWGAGFLTSLVEDTIRRGS